MQAARRPRRRTSVAVLVLALCGAGIALAGPAAAVDDPARPDARVTHGPSCRPGGVVVEVTGGAVAYAVTLGTGRRPAGEDAADVAPGAVAVLRTGAVDWGETIDPFLAFRALDGSGTDWIDDLPGYSFTRPAAEDCAAISPPAGAAVVPRSDAARPAPGPAELGGVAAAGLDDGPPSAPVAAPEATAVAGGVPWALLGGGSALVAAGTGLALVAAGRRRAARNGAPPFPGSA